ncbi:MAG: hypothetical protein ABIP19_10725 [Dermatophilaceae bacterium]
MTPAWATRHPATTRSTPGVDYYATSERTRYEQLSPAVREAAEIALGSSVVSAAPPVTSGFTRAYAGRVALRDGRHAFLKATGPELPIPIRALRREAQMLSALGSQIPAVPLVGAGEADDGGQVRHWNGSTATCPAYRGRTTR